MRDVAQSHLHSLLALEILNGFDDFKESIGAVADLGCGKGNDLEYWANMTILNEDGEPGVPLNLECVGFDKNIPSTPQRDNITYIKHDLNSKKAIPYDKKFDVVWCHDVMQYIYSPVEFLGRVNRAMNLGGMLYLSVPSTVSTIHNIFQNYTPPMHYNTFTVSQVLYLLVLNGFDIKDFYLDKHKHEDEIQVIVYKESEPLDYDTSWYKLVDLDLLDDNMKEIVLRNGILTDQGVITKWIDGTVHDFRWHS